MANFIKHDSCPNCGSADNLALYDDGSYFCFSYCGYKSLSKDFKDSLPERPKARVKTSAKQEYKTERESKVTKELITVEENEELKSITELTGGNYRKISDEVLKFYGCRTEFDDEGAVVARYYPYTIKGELAGYKKRLHPKTFGGNIGNTGKDCDLYGQFRFSKGGKYVLLVEGEEDCHAAYQMFLEYARSKESDFVTAVVSVGQGVASSKQIANNYEFLNKFENIIVGLDADAAGEDGLEKIVAALPKGKVKIAKWDKKLKDPNKYLEEGQQKKFLADFYNAESYVPVGVVGSGHLYDRMLMKSGQPKVPFPPLVEELNQLFVGGLTLGIIVNIASDTGTGKTTIVNELIYYWIFNSPYKVGILSMELDDAQYAEVMVSRHIEKKLALMPDDQKKEYIRTDGFKKAADELFKNPDGSDRFYLVDDRDGSVEDLQNAIEQLIIGAGCKVIVVDVLQDVLDGLSNEEQAVFMKWAKSMIKSHGVTFIFINHKRKSASTGNGSGMNEADIHGSSTIIKSAGINILIGRDKMNENEVIRNTTVIEVPKNRLTGLTGPAGALFYVNEEHKLYNFKQFFGMSYTDWLNANAQNH